MRGEEEGGDIKLWDGERIPSEPTSTSQVIVRPSERDTERFLPEEEGDLLR